MVEDEYIKTEILTEQNIAQISEKTGRSVEELTTIYHDAKAQGKEAVIMMTKLSDLWK